MITALDSNVLVDIFSADRDFGPRSRLAVTNALSEGVLVVSEVVWAECVIALPSVNDATQVFGDSGIIFVPMSADAATLAGETFRAYRKRGGPRERIISDFLVGAHARIHADRLITRDRGFYREYFTGLVIFDPSA